MTLTNLVFPTSAFLVGPAIHFLAIQVFESEGRRRMRHYFHHFFPGLFFLIGTILIAMSIPGHSSGLTKNQFIERCVQIGMTLASMHAFAYFGMVATRFAQTQSKYDQAFLYITGSILVLPFLGMLMILISFPLGSIPLLGAGTALITMACGTFLYLTTDKSFRYTNFGAIGLTNNASREAHKYLRVLMEDQKMYRNAKLRVKDVTELIEISEKQLAKMLHEMYKLKFHEFVNKYRVGEAKHVLLDCPDWTIKRVSDYCGFPGVSVFERYFSQFEGTTPRKFRQRGDMPRPELAF